MKHGGPAFPGETEHQPSLHTMHYPGMTLRDYFAAKAMQSVLGILNGVIVAEEAPGDFNRYAEAAYAIADAMILRREAT